MAEKKMHAEQQQLAEFEVDCYHATPRTQFQPTRGEPTRTRMVVVRKK